ncbi:6-phosphogluconate dehydrogenase family protein [Striga asiatica]|uniref:6-phosphogluconate dehydrogenase family protein n=1 Tax=Striga asiatica TaxID=4170 RepID=A0A5A7R6K7_STRAF|nr:6-phosphogluconate dehydrogenase family protein [Striga asiatica]
MPTEHWSANLSAGRSKWVLISRKKGHRWRWWGEAAAGRGRRSVPLLGKVSKASLLPQNDDVPSLRRRNKSLILAFFTLIFLLTLIIGGIIIHLVPNHSSPDPNPAVHEFCRPTRRYTSCLTALDPLLATRPDLTPDQVLAVSIETSRVKLARIPTRWVESGASFDPDLETRSYEQMEDLIRWVADAAEDLGSCAGYMGRAGSTAAIGLMDMVGEVGDLIGYGKEFLLSRVVVNGDFGFGAAAREGVSWWELVKRFNLVEAGFFWIAVFCVGVSILLACESWVKSHIQLHQK